MKKFLLFLFTLLSVHIYSQAVLLTPNGSFETGSPLPTKSEQLNAWNTYATIANCGGWTETKYPNTVDWYTIQNYPDAMKGGCPFNYGTAQNVINALPKLATAPQGSFYAGCGNHETMIYDLIQPTCKNSKVKLSFWFALRSTEGIALTGVDRIVATLQVKGSSTVNAFNFFEMIRYSQQQPLFTPCQWYYVETNWIPTDNNEYTQLLFGNGDPNVAGGFTEAGYTYFDDVKLYNGCSCCPDHMQYENTSSLPPVTVMDNYIRAGYDAGVPNTSGNVSVLSGQTVVFKAPKITLEPGFNTAPTGANFQAIIEECSPYTHPNPEPVTLITPLPNVITPDGNTVNDQYCFQVFGADEYRFRVYDRWGLLRFDKWGGVESNFPCVWDGICNVNCSGLVCNDTYFYILDLFNCKNGLNNNAQLTTSGNVAVFGSTCQPMHTDATDVLNKLEKSHLVTPNPTSGLFTLTIKESILSEVFIYNNLGQLIHQEILRSSNSQIDLSSHPKGIYFIKVQSADKIYTDKVVVQ